MSVTINKVREIEDFVVDDDGVIPNSKRPAGVYRNAISFEELGAGAARNQIKAQAQVELGAFVKKNGWEVQWLYFVYQRLHYHSTTDEVLAVYSGSATLELGGPNVGRRLVVRRGDVVYIPAGVAHCALHRTKDFLVFGIYPQGKKWDMLYGAPNDRVVALKNLEHFKSPQQDPFYGKEGFFI
jgi:uncharacterized protein YjlB